MGLFLVPDLYVYGAIAYSVISAVILVLTFWTSRDYVKVRIQCFFTGKSFTEAVDLDGSSGYEAMEKKAGSLIGNMSEHIISLGGAIRNSDGTKFYVNKRLGLVLTPYVITAVNNLIREKGFKSFPEALTAFEAEYCKQEYADTIGKVIDSKDKNLIKEAKKEFARKVKEKLYITQTGWTQDLTVIYDWTAQPLDAYSNRNLAERERLEGEKSARSGGIPMDRVFQYVIAAIVVLGAVVIIMNLFNAGAGAAVTTPPTTTTTIINATLQNLTAT